MNRSITNTIRFFMDECIPPIIRDSKYFMYPFYYYAYRGKNIKRVMNFKSLVYSFSTEEYNSFYKNLDTISRNRTTDLNKKSLDHIINSLDNSAQTLLDVGCGNGYFLKKLGHTKFQLSGCDIAEPKDINGFLFYNAKIEKLPFSDKQFDIVTCFHTLEHIVNIETAVSELKRITKKQLIIVIPCQRYYYYTLDEHVHFFPFKEKLTSLIDIKDSSCEKIWGDWVYNGRKADDAHPNKLNESFN